jgi:hypothetical protein
MVLSGLTAEQVRETLECLGQGNRRRKVFLLAAPWPVAIAGLLGVAVALATGMRRELGGVLYVAFSAAMAVRPRLVVEDGSFLHGWFVLRRVRYDEVQDVRVVGERGTVVTLRCGEVLHLRPLEIPPELLRSLIEERCSGPSTLNR